MDLFEELETFDRNMDWFEDLESLNRMSFNFRRRYTLRAIQGYLYCTYSISSVRNIGSGGYGDVVELILPNKPPVAGKVILEEAKSIGEEKLWPTLDHPNVLRLLDTIDIVPIKAAVYITNILHSDIHHFILDGNLRNGVDSLDLIRRWLRDILQGIHYLQKKGLSHLDIKINNILLTKKLKAVIADFSTLHPHQRPISKYGGPYFLMPPESGAGKQVEGTSFDSWCIGTMALEIFTGGKVFLEANIRDERNWYENAYPKIYKCLQYDVFESLVREAMPQAENLNRMSIELMRNFVYMHLKINPQDRPLANTALDHEFLKEGFYTVKPDFVWTHQVSQDELMFLVRLYDRLNYDHSYESIQRFELNMKENIYRKYKLASVIQENICKSDQQEISLRERDIPTTSRTLTSYEAEQRLCIPPSLTSKPQLESERRKKSPNTEKVFTEEERRRQIEKLHRLIDYRNGYKDLLTKHDSNESNDKYANCSFDELESIIQENMCKCQRQKRRVRERAIPVKVRKRISCKKMENQGTRPSQSSLPQPASKSINESLNAEEVFTEEEKRSQIEKLHRLIDYPYGYKDHLTKRDSNESNDKYANCSFEELKIIIEENICKCEGKKRVRESVLPVMARRLIFCKKKGKKMQGIHLSQY